jgi:hypothetical protein
MYLYYKRTMTSQSVPFLVSKASKVGSSDEPDGRFDGETQRWSIRNMATTWCQTTTTGDAMSGVDPDQEEDDERDSW